jgi:YD repeat-containing protein
MVLGNGETLSRSYDTLFRIDQSRVGSLYQRDYDYWANSQIKSITDPVGTKDHAYTYDQLGHLDTASGPYGTLDFDHDQVGNREMKTANTTEITSYSYETGPTNRIDQITGAENIDYTLDAAGLLGTTSADAAVFTWTDDQRLGTVSKNGVQTAAYQYDGQGLRTVKTVNGNTTLFVYDKDGKLLAEANA